MNIYRIPHNVTKMKFEKYPSIKVRKINKNNFIESFETNFYLPYKFYKLIKIRR
jgi:hypothetical protein